MLSYSRKAGSEPFLKVMSYVLFPGLEEAIKPINLLVNYVMMKYKITAMKR